MISTIRKVLADARAHSPVPPHIDFAVCAAGLLVGFVASGIMMVIVP